jgi:essential nuclear protein 1
VAKATTRGGGARGVGAAAADSSDEEDDDDGDGGGGDRPGLGTDVYDDDDERLVAQGGGGYDYGGAEVADEVSPEDEAALRAFMGGAGGGAAGGGAKATTTEGLWGAPAEAGAKPSRDLAGLVLERMREKQQQQQQQEDEHEDGAAAGKKTAKKAASSAAADPPLDERVAEVYRGVGQLLRRYTSGPLPKALKVVPSLRSWEQALALTSPEEWSPHAHYACARLFISNLSDRTAPRYLRTVLLPAVREDIRSHQRLHFALFQALRKSTYKPGAFFKGVLLPLCAEGDCSLREAVILSSVLKRASLPALHSAAALLRLSKLPYCGTTSFFLRVLLDKRYALPYAVVDSLVDHFCAFSDDERQMPVVWHQSLLCFAQRYKEELSAKDVGRLRQLCDRQHHYAVTPEVLRELDAADAAAAVAGGKRRGGGGAAAAAAGGGAAAAAPAAAGAPGAAAAKVVALVGTGAAREDPRDLPPVFMGDDE